MNFVVMYLECDGNSNRQFNWTAWERKASRIFVFFELLFTLNVCLTYKRRVTIIHRSLLIIFKLFINGINYHGSHVIECSSVSDSNPCDLHTHSIAHLQRNVLRWWRRRRRRWQRWQRRRLNTHAKPSLRIFSYAFFSLRLNIQIYFLQHISIFICQTCRRRRRYQFSVWPICHKSTV